MRPRSARQQRSPWPRREPVFRRNPGPAARVDRRHREHGRLYPSPDALYSATKYAVIGLVRSLALTVPENIIAVNAVCPGLTDTPLTAPMREFILRTGRLSAPLDLVVDAVEKILAGGGTGQVWMAEAGQPIAQAPSSRCRLRGDLPRFVAAHFLDTADAYRGGESE